MKKTLFELWTSTPYNILGIPCSREHIINLDAEDIQYFINKYFPR